MFHGSGSYYMPTNGMLKESLHQVHNTTGMDTDGRAMIGYDPYLEAYAKVYPNLIRHSKDYPTPEYLKIGYLPGEC